MAVYATVYRLINGHLDVARLLEKGAEIDHADNGEDGWTPPPAARHQGHIDVERLLLEKGANIEKETSKGDTHSTSPARKATSSLCDCCWRKVQTLIR